MKKAFTIITSLGLIFCLAAFSYDADAKGKKKNKEEVQEEDLNDFFGMLADSEANTYLEFQEAACTFGVSGRHCHYPEEENTKIQVFNKKSPLDVRNGEPRFDFFNNNPLFEFAIGAGANKFSLGTGVINVKKQVRLGTRKALQDVLTGYPEFQRREFAREVIVASHSSHLITNNFILGPIKNNIAATDSVIFSNSSSNNPLAPFIAIPIEDLNFFGGDKFFLSALSGVAEAAGEIAGEYIHNAINGEDEGGRLSPSVRREIAKNEYIPSLIYLISQIVNRDFVIEANNLFKGIALSLLVLFLSLIVFTRLSKNNYGLDYLISGPLFKAIGLWFLISYSGEILNLIIKAFDFMNITIISGIGDFWSPKAFNFFTRDLNKSWEFIANRIGYYPGIFLASLDLIAQFIFYFYIAGLFLYLVIGKIISPIWGLLAISDSTRSQAINSFINWIKALLVVLLIPVIYLAIYFIIREFSDYNLHILNVVLSIASLLLLPISASAILARGNGIFQGFTSSYEIIVDTLNSSFLEMRNFLETSSRTHTSQDHELMVKNYSKSFSDNSVHNSQKDLNSHNHHKTVNTIAKYFDKVRLNTVNSVNSSPVLSSPKPSFEFEKAKNIGTKTRFNHYLDGIIRFKKLEGLIGK